MRILFPLQVKILIRKYFKLAGQEWTLENTLYVLNSKTYSGWKVVIHNVVERVDLFVELFSPAYPYLYQTVFHYVNIITMILS